MSLPRLLLPAEAAALLNVSARKLDQMRYDGKIVYVKIGRILYDEADVIAFANTPHRPESMAAAQKWAKLAVLLRRDTRKVD